MNVGDSCNIIPQTKNVHGQEIDSPLYLDLAEMYKGDRDKAVSLYTKLTSKEVIDAVNALPENLAQYYPDTKTPTLATCLNVSNAEKEDPSLTQTLKEWLQSKVDFKVERARDLANVVKFNEGEWNTRFQCTFDYHGNVFIHEHSDAPNRTIPEMKFSSKMYASIKDILKSLNMTEDDFDVMMKDTNIVVPRMANFAPETFLDLCLAVYNFANDKAVRLTPAFVKYPNKAIAKVLLKYNKGSQLYERFMADLQKDDKYLSRFSADEINSYTKEELLEEAAARILSSIIGKERVNKDTSTTLASRLVDEFRSRVKNNSKITLKNIKEILLDANSDTSAINDDFLGGHPQFAALDLVDSQVAIFQSVLDKISKSIIKYLDISKHRYSESETNTEDFSEDIATMYHSLSSINRAIGFSDVDEVGMVMRNIILNLQKNTKTLQGVLNSLSGDKKTSLGILSNNVICGKLRQATFTIQYIENILSELERVNNFQQSKNIKSNIFTTEVNSIIKDVYSILTTSKQKVTSITRETVINELEKVFPNTQFTLPSGERVSVREWVESDSAVYDIMGGVERFVVSVSECSNPILTLLDSYKKRMVEEGTQVVNEIEHNIINAAEGLCKAQGKDTRWMFKLKEEEVKDSDGNPLIDEDGNVMVTRTNIPSGKYIMDYNYSAFEKDYRNYVNTLRDRKDLSVETKLKMLEEWQNSHTEERPDLDGKRHPSRKYYYNLEFDALTQEQKDYWKVFMQEKAKLVSYFPERNYGLDDAIFIRKRDKELIKTQKGKGLRKIFRDRWKRYSSREVQFGQDVTLTDFANEAIYELPTFYNYLREGETMDDISTDTTSSLLSYAEAMMNAAALKNVVNVLECAGDVIQNMRYKDRGTDAVRQIVHRVGKYKDSEEYQKAVSQLSSLKMYKEWLTMQVYGQRVSKKHRKARLIIGDVMTYINFGTLALNTLSPISNIIQGINQLTPTAIGGYFFNMKDLTKANLLYDKYMFKPTKDCGLLETGAHKHNNKFLLIANKFNFTQDFDRSNIKYSDTRVERMIESDSLYFLMHAGEHYLQSTGALALMYNSKNQVRDASGNHMTAFDAYDTVKLANGGSKLVLKKGLTTIVNNEDRLIVTNEELEERARKQGKLRTDKSLLAENEISEGEWVSSLKQKISGVNNYLHGIYNKEDQTRAQYFALGRAAMMYRKYLIPSLNRRFGVSTYIAGLDTEVEGYYRTFFGFNARLMKELVTDQYKSYSSLNDTQKEIVDEWFTDEGYSREDIPAAWEKLDKKMRRSILFGTKGAWNTVKSTLTDFQKSNLKMAWADISKFYALVVANLLLDFDDDDDDTVSMAALKYFLRRDQTEIGALSPASLPLWFFSLTDKKENPELYALGRQNMLNEFWQLFKQPIAGQNHLEDIIVIPKVLQFNNLFEPAHYDKDKFNNEWERQFYKIMTPWRHYRDWTVETLHRKENWYKQ